MQTKTPTPSRPKLVKAPGFSSVTVKSFGDLAAAFQDSEIDAFALNIRQGIDHWRTAGKLLVAMTEKHPEAMTRIRQKTGLSDSVLQTFARIGRNEIWPPLLVDSSMGARRLLECHYDDQKKYAEEPIEIAISWSKDGVKTKKKKISELSRSEIAIVFSEGSINTIDQQAWRLREPSKKEPVALKPTDPAPEYLKPRMVNVDIDYFSIVISPNGKIVCEPCGKSAMAQPVRVIPNGSGHKSAIIVLYEQKSA